MKQSRCTKKYVFLKVVTSLRITALVNDDAGTNLSSQQGCFFSCVVWKGRLVWEEANQLYMSWEWRSKKKMSQTSFTTTLDKTCFLTPPYIRFLVQTEAAASNILSYLSFLSGSIWFTNTEKKKKEKRRVAPLHHSWRCPKNTPVVHTCFLAQSVLCVPYKPCHALLFTICAHSPSVREGGEEKKRWDRR